MAALQEALKCLTGTSWDSIPTNQDDLRAYITELSSKARLIIDSVPEPPPSDEIQNTSSNSSRLSRTVRPSTTRLGTTDETTLSHQREWSTAVKINNPKDNPLGIPIYKLPGSDSQGHWFGRRSIHEGLPYPIWEEKLSGEIAETLRNNQERVKEGLPADHAVRGIGAEKQLESVEVLDEKGKNVIGRVNVFHVLAQFPRPTTSRDFVTMIISWEGGVDDRKGERVGRNWMMVSRPCAHPDGPEVQDYIRGEYESVEMVREILVEGRSTSGSGSGSTEVDGERGDEGRDLDESNPVEWIMVTRSDPGGTIPRWIVEKGTPRSICADAAKFLDWACQRTSPATKEQRSRRSTAKSETSQPATADGDGSDEESSDSDLSDWGEQEHHGLIASLGHLLRAGLEHYAPQAVLDYMPQHPRQSSTHGVPGGDSREVHEDTAYARPAKDEVDAQDETPSQASINPGLNTEQSTPRDINLDISPAEIIQTTRKGKFSSHERQLTKLAQQRRSVEAQLRLVQSDIQSLRLRPSEDESRKEKAAALSSGDTVHSNNQSPAGSIQDLGSDGRTSSSSNLHSRAETPIGDNPKINKVASALFREESKLLQRLAKIERHQIKEAAKIEARHRKEAEKQDKVRSRDEADGLRREMESLKKENERLKSERKQWLSLIGSLQAENTKLARQVGAEGAK